MVDLFVVRTIDLLTDGMVDLFVFESTDRTVQYKLNAQSLRLFGLRSDVNDAHRAGANRLQNKKQNQRRQCRRRLTHPPASLFSSTAFAGKHSGCSLHVVTALSGVHHCLDLYTLSTWNR